MNYHIAVYSGLFAFTLISRLSQNKQNKQRRDFRISFCQIRSVYEVRECLVDKRRVLTSIQTLSLCQVADVSFSTRTRVPF